MKTKTLFVCQQCGAQAPRWLGKCPSCEAWNSYVEEVLNTSSVESKHKSFAQDNKPMLLEDIVSNQESRLTTGIKEFDRVMGGGIVPGSVTLIGGDPGIGKSTLSLQVACLLAQQGEQVLYVSGEESLTQTKMRADRLLVQQATTKVSALKRLYLVNQVDLNLIIEDIKRNQPSVVILDSIQVVFWPEVSSSPGSVAQVRECSSMLTQLAKSLNIALFIIGHVTKEGTLAGPRVLEHIVDTVLYFEGERYSSYRILRAIKNRFGSTNEIGVFEMTGEGLMEVLNPSEIFLSERPKVSSGSVVTAVLEGTRPFLIEVQGLVARSAFGMVRHKAQGFDANRLALLVAVLEKRIGLRLEDQDVFLNVVGGVKLMDPAADLAVILAVSSAYLDKPMAPDTVVLGEVGLAAEVRSVSQLTLRVNEAYKLGFKRCLVPKNNLQQKNVSLPQGKIELVGVETVRQAMEIL